MSPKSAISAIALLLSSAGAAAAYPATATTDLNVRSGPGIKHSVVDKLQAGDTVEVTKTRGSWRQIASSGWVSGKYLRGGRSAALESHYLYDAFDLGDIAGWKWARMHMPRHGGGTKAANLSTTDIGTALPRYYR